MMDYRIEVITIPVSDVDAAVRIDFADPDGNTWIVQERGFTRAASTSVRKS